MAQKKLQPPEEEAEVVADGAHHGVDLVAEPAVRVVPVEMAVALAVADDGLDGASSPELLFDLAVHTALLAGLEDPERLRRIVTPVALVDIDPLDLTAGQRLGFLQHLAQAVAVIGIAGERLGMEDELAALGSFVGGGERDLDAELVRFGGFSLTDAFGLRGVSGIELPTPLALFLAADLRGLG